MFVIALLLWSGVHKIEAKLIGNVSFENWTTCEQFLEGTTFDKHSVIAVDWKIFYLYHFDFEPSHHIKFSLAPKGVGTYAVLHDCCSTACVVLNATPFGTKAREIVDRYKAGLDRALDPRVNWTDAEFFMETSIDFSALFIRTNVSGLYRIIPSYAFQNDRTSLFYVAMKTVDPGYLGMVNCKYRLCYVLAPSDRMPYDDELEEAAQTVGFKAESHYSYLEPSPRPPPTVPDVGADMFEEEDMEIDDDPNKYTFVQ